MGAGALGTPHLLSFGWCERARGLLQSAVERCLRVGKLERGRHAPVGNQRERAPIGGDGEDTRALRHNDGQLGQLERAERGRALAFRPATRIGMGMRIGSSGAEAACAPLQNALEDGDPAAFVGASGRDGDPRREAYGAAPLRLADWPFDQVALPQDLPDVGGAFRHALLSTRNSAQSRS